MMQVPGVITQKVVISVTAHVCFGIFTKLAVKDQIPSQYAKLVVSIFLIIESKNIISYVQLETCVIDIDCYIL